MRGKLSNRQVVLYARVALEAKEWVQDEALRLGMSESMFLSNFLMGHIQKAKEKAKKKRKRVA